MRQRQQPKKLAWCSTNKHDIAHRLEEIAFFLLLKGENPYKAKAYRNAGIALLMSPHEASDLMQTGMLTEVTGLGPATASGFRDY